MSNIECDLERLQGDDYDWEEVFKQDYTCPKKVEAVIFSEVPTDPFTREDVSEVIASVDGERDRDNWVMVGKLKDGRFFSISAGCDYTGWG